MHGAESGGMAFLGDLGIALAAALVAGLASRALRLPVLVGYLIAGIAIGPHTPGFVANEGTVRSMADLGITLLMFAVGVQFSLEELRHVRRVALTVGAALFAASLMLGILLALAAGWGAYGGLFLGCALFLSSTAVMLRVLDERGELGTTHGAILMGVLVVQDLSFVLMIVLLPALASLGNEGTAALLGVGIALLKAAFFLAGTLVLATRLIPALLERLARNASRELFLLAMICLCLATGFAAERMGLGMALGAFLAGLVVSESPYAHEVFAQVRPLRDVFSCLFFVSVGMLLDPAFVVNHLGVVLGVSAAIILGKSLSAFVAARYAGAQTRIALLVGLGLAQIGEFSFVLASVGTERGLVPEEVSRVILSAALLTLLLTPFVYQSAAPLYRWLNRIPALAPWLHRQPTKEHEVALPPESEETEPDPGAPTTPERSRDHVIVLGYGRVGRYVSDALRAKQIPHLVVDYDANVLLRLKESGQSFLYGDVTADSVLAQTRPKKARLAVVALPEALSSEMVVRALKQLAPDLPVVVRLHRGLDIPRLRAAGADVVIHAEFEAGTAMIRHGLDYLGIPDSEVEEYLAAVRQHRYRE